MRNTYIFVLTLTIANSFSNDLYAAEEKKPNIKKRKFNPLHGHLWEWEYDICNVDESTPIWRKPKLWLSGLNLLNKSGDNKTTEESSDKD